MIWCTIWCMTHGKILLRCKFFLVVHAYTKSLHKVTKYCAQNFKFFKPCTKYLKFSKSPSNTSISNSGAACCLRSQHQQLLEYCQVILSQLGISSLLNVHLWLNSDLGGISQDNLGDLCSSDKSFEDQHFLKLLHNGTKLVNGHYQYHSKTRLYLYINMYQFTTDLSVNIYIVLQKGCNQLVFD